MILFLSFIIIALVVIMARLNTLSKKRLPRKKKILLKIKEYASVNHLPKIKGVHY